MFPAIVCVLLAGFIESGQAASEGEVRARLQQLRDRIKQVRHKINSESEKKSRLAESLQEAIEQIRKIRHRLDAIEDAIQEHREKIASLSAKIADQRAELADQLSALREQVRAAYATGQPGPFQLLLSGSSPAEIGRQLAYYSYFTQAQSKQIQQLETMLAELAENRRKLKAERQALQAEREEHAAILADMKQNKKAQRSALAALDRRLSAHKQSVTSMRENAERLKDLLARIQKQLQNAGPGRQGNFAERQGDLPAPVDGSTIAAFGQFRDGGPLRWSGRWIATERGAPVTAVAPGQVVYIGYLSSYGLIVIVSHGNRYFTLYGHLASVFCRVGEVVVAGEKIATAGASGGYERSGVFFQVRRGDNALDPGDWLAD